MIARMLPRALGLSLCLLAGACQRAPLTTSDGLAGEAPSWPIVALSAASASMELTLYASGWTMALDARPLSLESGSWALRFEDVPATVEARGALLELPWKPQERRFLNDLAGRDQLLARYDGKLVEIWPKGATAPTMARLRYTDSGAIYQVGDRLYPSPPGRVALPPLPGLSLTPSLEWRGVLPVPWSGIATASYVIEHLGWQCEYTLVTDPDQTRGSWSQWAHVSNQTTAAFAGVRARLAIGDVRRRELYLARPMVVGGGMAADASSAPQEFAARYLLELPAPLTLRPHEEKRLALFDAASVPITRVFRFENSAMPYREPPNSTPIKARIQLELPNTAEAGLGLPLPRGQVTVYTRTPRGDHAIAGEVSMPDTPKLQPIRLDLGEAFDVTMRREQTAYSVESEATVTSYRLVVGNQMTASASIEVRENVGGDWTLVEASLPAQRVSTQQLRWSLEVGPAGERELRFTLRTRREVNAVVGPPWPR